MARIALAIAAPHSGMLGKPPETWLEDGLRDRRNPALWFRNEVWTYERLEAARRAEGLERSAEAGRGALDAAGVKNRKQARSRYGAKKAK